MKLQKRFGGDYRTEFGGDKPRPWSCHYIIHKNDIIGTCDIEPPQSISPFRVWLQDYGYIGSFETRKAMYKKIKELTN
jgi:hypothetical protein